MRRSLSSAPELDAAAEVASDGSWFRSDDRHATNLLGRPVLRRLLAGLARAALADDLPRDTATLVALGWPEDRSDEVSTRRRLHFAISELRRLGLRDAIVHQGGGYRLLARIRLTEPEPPRELVALPGPVDPFVGRADELAQLAAELAEHRIVTLAGPGGVGKTRLALELARRHLAELPGGVWWVDLTEAVTDDDILGAVGRAMGLPMQRDPASQIRDALVLRGGCAVVLDNAEGSARDCAERVGAAVAQWAERAQQAQFLCTSRIALRVRGELCFPLGPLPAEAGRRLYQIRAGQVTRSQFEDADIDALVADLDGLPLSIELAAARARTLHPRRLREQWREQFVLLTDTRTGVPDRHRSLAAMLAHSWDLAPPELQRAWQRLSVFAGGFDDDAAAVVLECDIEQAAALLDGLLDHHLSTAEVTEHACRFSMLQTLREYGTQRLRASDTASRVAELHRRHFADLGRAMWMAPHPDYPCALRREGANLWAAFASGLATGAREAAAWCLSAAWFAIHEGEGPSVTVARRGQELLAADLSEEVRAQVQTIVGLAALHCGAPDEAAAHLGAASRSTASPRIGTRCATGLGVAAMLGGDPAGALAHHRRATQIAREAGLRHLEGIALLNVGIVHYVRDEFDEQQEALSEAIAVLGAFGPSAALATAWVNVGRRAMVLDQREDAREAYGRGLALACEVGDPRSEALALVSLAVLELRHRATPEGLALLEAATDLFRRIGSIPPLAEALSNLANARMELGRPDEALATVREAVALSADTYAIEWYARSTLGRLLAEVGEIDEAAIHLQRAEELARRSCSEDTRATVLCDRGQVEVQRGGVAEAQRCLHEATALLAGLRHDGQRAALTERIAALAEALEAASA